MENSNFMFQENLLYEINGTADTCTLVRVTTSQGSEKNPCLAEQ